MPQGSPYERCFFLNAGDHTTELREEMKTLRMEVDHVAPFRRLLSQSTPFQWNEDLSRVDR